MLPQSGIRGLCPQCRIKQGLSRGPFAALCYSPELNVQRADRAIEKVRRLDFCAHHKFFQTEMTLVFPNGDDTG